MLRNELVNRDIGFLKVFGPFVEFKNVKDHTPVFEVDQIFPVSKESKE